MSFNEINIISYTANIKNKDDYIDGYKWKNEGNTKPNPPKSLKYKKM